MNICDACERHVYADEPSCPFCGSADPRRPIPRAPGGRLSRAAAHAVRAAVLAGTVGGTAGCYQAHGLEGTPGSARDAATRPVADAGRVVPGTDAGAEDDAGGSTAPDDADVADASTPDAGEVDADGSIPIYGGVFPDPRERAVV